ncbi:MAG TPA: 6-phosphogluconolactonase [Candidatus Dormibacteraeota bacterium]
MNIEVLEDAAAVAAAAADWVSRGMAGGGTLVLAGGGTPRRCYELLDADSLPWGRVTVLFGDERCVPPDDEESNFRMAREALLDRVRPLSVHRMPGELVPEEGAELYARIVEPLRPLDLVLLGMGPDGHTASLFPGHQGLHAAGSAIAVHDSPKPPPDRVSLTLEVLQEARQVLMLVAGAGKRDAVARARRGEVPAGMVPQATWLIDRAAAPA